MSAPGVSNLLVLLNEDIWNLSIGWVLFGCVATTLATASIAFGFWITNRLMTHLVNPPNLNYFTFLSIWSVNALTGTTLAFLRIALCVVALYLCIGGNDMKFLGIFNGIEGDFLNGGFNGDATTTRGGRWGLSLCVLGSFFLREFFHEFTVEQQRLHVKYINDTKYMFIGGKIEVYFRDSTLLVVLYTLFVTFFGFSSEYNSSRQLVYLIIITIIGEWTKSFLRSAKGIDASLPIPFMMTIEIANLFVSRLSSYSFFRLAQNHLWMVFSRFLNKAYVEPASEDLLRSSIDLLYYILKGDSNESNNQEQTIKLVPRGLITVFWYWCSFNKYTKLIFVVMLQFILGLPKQDAHTIEIALSGEYHDSYYAVLDVVDKALKAKKLAEKKKLEDGMNLNDMDNVGSPQPHDESDENGGILGVLAGKQKNPTMGKDGKNIDFVEPILLFLCDVSVETTASICSLFGILFMWAFSDQLRTSEFNEQLVVGQYPLYIYFSLFTVCSVMLSDPMRLSISEFVNGCKTNEYLVYSHYRFLQRETRWKPDEASVDECITDDLRSIDRLGFSSQYFLRMSSIALSVMLLILGLNMCLVNNYTPFFDYMAIPIFLLVYGIHAVEQFLLLQLWDWNIFYRIKHENKAWTVQKPDVEPYEIDGSDVVAELCHRFEIMQKNTADADSAHPTDSKAVKPQMQLLEDWKESLLYFMDTSAPTISGESNEEEKNEFTRRQRKLRLVKEQLKKGCTDMVHKIIDGSFAAGRKVDVPSLQGQDGGGGGGGGGEKVVVGGGDNNTLPTPKDKRRTSTLSDSADFIVALVFSLLIIFAILPFSLLAAILFGPFVFFFLSHHGIGRYREKCWDAVGEVRCVDALSSCGMACCGIFPMCLCGKPYGPYPRCVGFCLAIAATFGGIVGLYMFVEEVVTPSLPQPMWIIVVALVPGLSCGCCCSFLIVKRRLRRRFLLAKIERRRARRDSNGDTTNNIQSGNPPQKQVQLASDDSLPLPGVSQTVHIKKHHHHHHKKKKTKALLPDNVQESHSGSVVTEQPPDGIDDGASVVSSSIASLSVNHNHNHNHKLDQPQVTTMQGTTSASSSVSMTSGISRQQEDGDDDVRSFVPVPIEDVQSVPAPSRHAERHRLEDEKRRQRFLAADGHERGLRGVGKEAREGKKAQALDDRPFSS